MYAWYIFTNEGTINKDYDHMMAYADRENGASQRVLEKAGFKRGRLFPNQYIRALNLDSGKRSDLQSFYLDRPGTTHNEDWLSQQAPHISVDDVASIRNILENDGVFRGSGGV